jgi:CubicO group peptidase (beta-lactamase class C family)
VLSLNRILWIGLALTTARSPITQEKPRFDTPLNGTANAAFDGFDEFLTGFMEKHRIPGGGLAVLKDGRLVYARGYGYSDKSAKTPFSPNTLARIASVSKPVTAVAVLG